MINSFIFVLTIPHSLQASSAGFASNKLNVSIEVIYNVKAVETSLEVKLKLL
ncbi:hypothetical protein [Lactococcus lactis]|uniref:hypothetical protein n=1 Tax=Lactococcus lactis TaxID=1358 RepID=UPI00223B4CF2|nr:hypothetical protein [Lactococcus lactis]